MKVPVLVIIFIIIIGFITKFDLAILIGCAIGVLLGVYSDKIKEKL